MKKYLKFIIVFTLLITSSFTFGFDQLDIFVPEVVPADQNSAVDEEIQGAANGYEVIFNTVFNDIREATYEKEIIKMAAEGVVEKYGSYAFEPSKNITGYEALTFLVRFLGNEDVVQQNVLNNARGLDINTVQEMFNEEYFNQAQGAGIITAAEAPFVNDEVRKEQLAKWVFRVSNLQEQFGDLTEVFGFNDWLEVDPASRGIIQAVVNEGIMSYDNDGNFSPDKKVTRGEMAGIMDKLSESMYVDRNIESNFGLVIDRVQREENNQSIKDFIVKNADGTSTKITTSKNNETNQRIDFAAYKNDIPSSSQIIKIGDEINYFTKDGEVYFAEVLGDQSVLEKINEINKSLENIDLLLGTVKEISEEKHNTGETVINRTRIRFSTIDGNTYDLMIDTDLQTGIEDDVIVFKDGKAAGTELLEIGDQMELLIENDRLVNYIKVGDFETQLVNGTVRSVDENSIEVFDYNDRINTYPISKYNSIVINNRPGAIEDLNYGQNVSLEINNGYVTAIKSETFINPGYIPEFGKAQQGEVYRKYNSGIYFLLENGDRVLYKVSEDTEILKEGRNIDPVALKEGDKVTLYFDDIYTDELSKVQVDGRERLISQVYKGTLESFNQGNMSMVLSKPSYLKNTYWEDVPGYNKTIILNDGVELYDGAQRIQTKNFIRDYKGETVYAVVEAAYGDERGIHVTVKNGGEFIDSDRIDTVDVALNRVELDNNQNFNYNDGTIILKDGRLIDHRLLQDNDTVLVVSDYYRGTTTANIVKVTTMFDSIFDNIYFGTLEDVNTNNITLKNFTTINGNEINEINPSESRQYYYFTESVIKDLTDPDDVKTLSRNDLFHGGYARTENKSVDGDGVPYEKYYTTMVTNGNLGVIGMNLRHKSLMPDQDIDDTANDIKEANEMLFETLEDKVLTRGIISERLDLYNRLKVTDTHDYMGYRGGWVPNDSDTYFEYTNALIVKNDKVLDPEDIAIGDYVYFVRINEDALVIFVEDE